MLSLFVRRDNFTQALDLMESQPISLNFQFQDLSNINGTTGSFSQSFRLPVTKVNARFFTHAEDPDYSLVTGAFNPKTKYEAWIADDGIPILAGSLQLTQVIRRNGRAHEYEVLVVGNTGDLITEIKNKKLSDLDLTTLRHYFSKAELGISYNATDGGEQTTTGGLLANSLAPTSNIDSQWEGHFCYSIFDYRPLQGAYTQYMPYDPKKLVPFIKVHKILELIMGETGYTYSSDFFSSTGEGYKVWMPIYNGLNQVQFYDDTQHFYAWGATTHVNEVGGLIVGNTTYDFEDGWQVESQYVGDPRLIAPFPYDPSVTYLDNPLYGYPTQGDDPDNCFQSNGVVEVNAPGGYDITITTTWRKTQSEANGEGTFVYMAVYRQLTAGEFNYSADSEVQDELVSYESNVIGIGQGTYMHSVFGVPCEAGDRFYAVIAQGAEVWNGSSYQEASWVVQSHLDVSTGFNLTDETTYVDLNAMMPDMGLMDYMVGLQKTFNLLFVPDEDRKHFTIEPANDYLYTGANLAWHDKVDYSSDIVMKPTTDLQSRKYNFKHAEGSNYLSVSFQESAMRVPGRHKIEDTENDWATGDTEVTNGFAPFTPARGTQMIYAFQPYDGSGEETSAGDQPPMLCYGFSEDVADLGNSTWYIGWDFGASGFGNNQFIPHTLMVFSPFSAFPATLGDKALLYGEDRFDSLDYQPLNTLFREYWEDYFLEQYSTEARIMECRMYLTKNDINQLNFADTIYLNEGIFRLLSVSNYTANAEEPCSVTLIRAVQNIRPCEYVPSSVTQFLVTFTDADGNTGLTGSKRCCEYYGYQWVSGKCQPNMIPQASKGITQRGILGSVIQAIGANLNFRDVAPLYSVNQALKISEGLITSIPIEANAEIIKAENIEQSTSRNFASTTQLNTIASNTLSIDGNTTSITAIETKTDFITITSNHNLDTTKTKVGYITTGASGISAFTIEPTAKPLTADQISTTSTTNKFVTQTELNKLSLIGVSTAINLDSVESRVTTNETDIGSIEDKTGNISLASSGRIASISTDFGGDPYTYIPAYSQWLYTAIPPAEASSGKYVSNMKVLDYGSTTAVEDANLYQIHHLLNGNYADASTCPPLYGYACNSYAMLDPLNPSDAGHRSGQSGVRLVTIDNTGKLSEIADGTSGFFLKTDGSGNLSWGKTEAGWHNSATNIKVLPHEWTMNDDYNRAPIMVEDDTTGTLGIKMPASATEAYAMIAIPLTYEATHVQVYASASTASAVEVYSYNHTTGAIVSKGSGAFNSSIDITDVSASATQNLCIKIIPASATTLIYGADVTIAEV